MNPRGAFDPGELFAGDFRVVRLLAQGGMGAVYLADQLSTGQPRALKVLHAQYAANGAMRHRFEQEARVTANVRSAHIVQTLSAGIDAPSGHPWIAMELLEGQTLEQRYPEGTPASPEELALVLAQLGHGLSAAHDAGIVHRDLKPDNILFCPSQLQGLPFVVKLIDFGIAKIAQMAPSPGTSVMGSPLWMAPEQLSAQSQLTTATDVWALGLLAFRLLTGRYYWKAARSADLLPLIQELSLSDRVPASERARELGLSPLLPPGFDAWFAQCLRRLPSERFANARLAIDALMIVLGAPPERFAITQPSMARATTAPPPPLPPPPPSDAPGSAASPGEPSVLGTPGSPSPGVRGKAKSPRLVIRNRDLRTVESFVAHHGTSLSLDGMTLVTPHPLPEGSAVRVEMRIADDRLIGEGRAVVRSVSGEQMRLQFSQLRGPLVDELARRENAPGLRR